MTFLEVHQRFQEFEHTESLFSWKIDGISIWERIRFPIYIQIMQNLGLYESAERTQQKFNRSKRLLQAFRYAMNSPWSHSKTKYLVIGIPRRKPIQSTWWDIYLDPLLETLQGQYLYLEPAYMGRHFTPPKSDPIAYFDSLDLLGKLYKKLFKIELKKKQLLHTQKMEKKLSELFGTNVRLVAAVLDCLQSQATADSIFGRLLDRLSPSILLLGCSYGKESLISVAKRRKIPVIEVQHGSITPYHYAYHFPPGYHKETFPDYFLAFGDFWLERANLPLPKANQIAVGFPYFEKQLSCVQAIRQKRITFLSQVRIGSALSRLATECADSPQMGDYQIAFKLHPYEYSDWRTRYPHLLHPRIKVIDNDRSNFYETLSSSEFIAGVYSTAIYEALACGCKPIIYQVTGSDATQFLIDQQWAAPAKNTEDVVDLLLRKDAFKPIPRDHIFATNALKNFQNAFSEILSRNGISHLA